MRSYEAARGLFSFLAFCAWSVVLIGALVVLIGASGGSRYGGAGAGLLAMVPGIGIVLAGLLLVAFVQMGRATVDTAEYTQQMLSISRDQLDVSKRSLIQGTAIEKGFAALQNGSISVEAPSETGFAADPKKQGKQNKTTKIAATSDELAEGEQLKYSGKTITRKAGMYIVDGSSFEKLEFAKKHAIR